MRSGSQKKGPKGETVSRQRDFAAFWPDPSSRLAPVVLSKYRTSTDVDQQRWNTSGPWLPPPDVAAGNDRISTEQV